MRRLESVASSRQLISSRNARIRRTAFDVTLCFGLPCVQLVLRYITQGHRYDIIEHIGCQIPAHMSWPNIIITSVIPLALAIGATIYARQYRLDRLVAGQLVEIFTLESVFAFRWFLLRRLQFKAVLNASNTGLSTGRYLRLIALAATDISLVFFATLFILIASVRVNGISSYSWTELHAEFSPISQFPQDILPSGSYPSYATTVYLYPIYSFSFFVFFGFGEEAIQEYMTRWSQVTTLLSRLFGSRYVASAADPVHECVLILPLVIRSTSQESMQLPTLGTHATPVLDHPDESCTTEADSTGGVSVPQKRVLNTQGIPVSIEISVV